jgi:hypothetical protein
VRYSARFVQNAYQGIFPLRVGVAQSCVEITQIYEMVKSGSTPVRAAKPCNTLRGEEPSIKRGLNLAWCL